jgi:hypothetical protein
MLIDQSKDINNKFWFSPTIFSTVDAQKSFKNLVTVLKNEARYYFRTMYNFALASINEL